ncbi:asparaginase [Candidatus Woesearchaeota archaeon]|nr:asparaginase [Candidatus Woesearchaeota archaeon]
MPTKKPSIHLILTGGTIDSYWNGIIDTAVPLKESCIPQFIQLLKLYEEVLYTTICMKDSRQLEQTDRKKILAALEKGKCKKIIITHGTYTMPDTAKYLQANLQQKDQTIILTGSIIPLTGFSPSDAPFNLGFSFAKVQELAAGVYISMNGRIFTPNEIIKLLSEGRFASVFGEK